MTGWTGFLCSGRSPVTLALLAGLLTAPAAARGQATAPDPSSDPNRPFEITDNSFLVEEAFNQEKGIFQNIFNMTRSNDGLWLGSFTQEWPLGGLRHQLSYTIPFQSIESRRGFADLLINYRYQLFDEQGRVPAVSPRFSIILPAGRQSDGFGNGVVGWQVNLPLSKQLGNVYLHGNAGVTWFPGVHEEDDSDGSDVTLVAPTAAASVIVRLAPMFNVLCEFVAVRNETFVSEGVTDKTRLLVVSPGIRAGWNIGSKQIVVGAAVPVTFEAGDHGWGVLGYFSYELPFQADASGSK